MLISDKLDEIIDLGWEIDQLSDENECITDKLHDEIIDLTLIIQHTARRIQRMLPE